GLLALAGILGVGEGHLFHHRKARRLVSGDFAKLGSLFQSFPSTTPPYSPLRDAGTQDFLLENITPDLMGDIGGCL
ncbi:hypothetical protein NLO86_26335, partial [Pseudomonas savastanoi]|uniref:hypothetical protein n=1 Tax=Pseudomonas savastanoi TaxID=29438 RepID=UPI0021098994